MGALSYPQMLSPPTLHAAPNPLVGLEVQEVDPMVTPDPSQDRCRLERGDQVVPIRRGSSCSFAMARPNGAG